MPAPPPVHAPAPTRLVAEGLSQLVPDIRLLTIAGAGHMGPLTHAPEVCALFVQHIEAAEAQSPAGALQGRRADMPAARSRSAEGVS